jgi:hypothetical protein
MRRSAALIGGTAIALLCAAPALSAPGLEGVPRFGHVYGQNPPGGLGDGGHTVCAVIGPLVVPGDYSTLTYAYSMLRTIQDGFGLPGYLGAANQVSALPASWN